MAGQADGSIIIDTELNSDGFKAGSAELLAAIKSLSEEVKTLRATLTDLFKKPLTPEVNTSGAEDQVAALEEQVRELEAAMEELRNAGPTGETAGPQVNMGGTTQKASELQREIDAVNTSVERLEPTFQKAMSGSESAMATFEGKASTLQGKIAELQERLDRVGQTKYPTQEYEAICAEAEKAKQKFDALLDRQEKMQALGVNENSAQWKSLQYDMELVSNKYHELIALKQQYEASGSAFQMGVDTSQYAQMEATLSAANARLQEMQAGTSQSEGIMRRLASAAGRVASFIGRAAASAAGALVSGIRSAASHMAKMLTHSKSMKGQFSGLISSAKKFTLSLLGARGVYALLRKAVSAYMAQNQQLASQLSACWSGIGNLLGPIITKLINIVAQAVAYVTSFLKLFGIFGKSATNAISSTGGAAASAAKETKKLHRELASFDELNVLSRDEDASDGGGGGGGGADISSALPSVTLPDWAKLMVDQLKTGQWAEAAKTLTGQLNSMIANVDWAGVGDQIGYYLNGALTFLATAITTFDWYNLGASLGEMINQVIYGVDWANLGVVLGWKIIALIEGLGGLFATLDWAALGKAFSDAFMGLWNAIDWAQFGKTLSDGFLGVLKSLNVIIEEVDWEQIGRDVGTFLSNIDWGGIIREALTALLSLYEILYSLLAGAITETDWVGIAEGIAKGVYDALANFDWAGHFESLGKLIGSVFKALFDIGKWLGEAISDGVDSAKTYFSDKIEECGGDIVSGIFKGIGDAIANVGTWLYDNVFKPFIDGFKAAFGIHSPSKVMAEQGNYIIEGLLQGITGAWRSIVSFFGGALSSLGSLIGGAWSNIKSGASAAWNGIKGVISGAWSGIKTGVSAGYNAVKSGVSSAWNSVKSITSTAWANVKSIIQNQGWYSIGSNICSGISNGISNGWNWLKKTVSNLAGNLLNTAKSVLGIHSPSRLFRDAVGLNIGLGVGEGIEASQGSVLGSVVSVADAIADEFNANTYTVGINANGNVVRGLNSFSDTISSSFENLLNRLQAIAENVTFRAPILSTGTVLPYAGASGAMNNRTAQTDSTKETIQDAIDDQISAMLTGFEALKNEIRELRGDVQGIEIGDKTIGRAAERYQRRMAVVNGG